MNNKIKVWIAIIWTFVAGVLSNQNSYTEFGDGLLSIFAYLTTVIISMAWVGTIPIAIAIWFKKKWFVIYMSIAVPLGLFWIYSINLANNI